MCIFREKSFSSTHSTSPGLAFLLFSQPLHQFSFFWRFSQETRANCFGDFEIKSREQLKGFTLNTAKTSHRMSTESTKSIYNNGKWNIFWRFLFCHLQTFHDTMCPAMVTFHWFATLCTELNYFGSQFWHENTKFNKFSSERTMNFHWEKWIFLACECVGKWCNFSMSFSLRKARGLPITCSISFPVCVFTFSKAESLCFQHARCFERLVQEVVSARRKINAHDTKVAHQIVAFWR